jgi:Replication-relaxation
MEPNTEPQIRRRSRMHRASTGKRIELQPRDLEIFRLLGRYRYLRSTYIHAFVGGDKTKLIERLGRLYHEGGFLNRPAEQWQSINARCQPAVYENTAKAEEAAHGLNVGERSVGLARGRMEPNRQFAHSLMICDILASIELGTRQDPGLRFVSWREILAKAQAAVRDAENPFQFPVRITRPFPDKKRHDPVDFRLTPDGLFGLEYDANGTKTYRFFALEADRNTMPTSRRDLQQSSYLKKLLAYREVVARELYKARLGLPNLMVLTVTVNDTHMRNIMELVESLTTGNGSKLFLFKTLTAFNAPGQASTPTLELLTADWERAGFEPFNISRQ